MSSYAVPLSRLLSSCVSHVRVAAAGEVLKNKKHLRRQGQYLVETYTFCSENLINYT